MRVIKRYNAQRVVNATGTKVDAEANALLHDVSIILSDNFKVSDADVISVQTTITHVDSDSMIDTSSRLIDVTIHYFTP